jgi:hypothetical protein
MDDYIAAKGDQVLAGLIETRAAIAQLAVEYGMTPDQASKVNNKHPVFLCEQNQKKRGKKGSKNGSKESKCYRFDDERPFFKAYGKMIDTFYEVISRSTQKNRATEKLCAYIQNKNSSALEDIKGLGSHNSNKHAGGSRCILDGIIEGEHTMAVTLPKAVGFQRGIQLCLCAHCLLNKENAPQINRLNEDGLWRQYFGELLWGLMDDTDTDAAENLLKERTKTLCTTDEALTPCSGVYKESVLNWVKTLIKAGRVRQNIFNFEIRHVNRSEKRRKVTHTKDVVDDAIPVEKVDFSMQCDAATVVDDVAAAPVVVEPVVEVAAPVEKVDFSMQCDAATVVDDVAEKLEDRLIETVDEIREKYVRGGGKLLGFPGCYDRDALHNDFVDSILKKCPDVKQLFDELTG